MYRVRLPAWVCTDGLTPAEQEALRWQLLPFNRKLRIMGYAVQRLIRRFRVDPREVWRFYRDQYEGLARTLGSQIEAMRRYDLAKDLAEFRVLARELFLPWVQVVAVGVWVVLLSALLHRGVGAPPEPLRLRVEFAREHIPATCFSVDGEVWIYDRGRELRPGDSSYGEARREVCG